MVMHPRSHAHGCYGHLTDTALMAVPCIYCRMSRLELLRFRRSLALFSGKARLRLWGCIAQHVMSLQFSR
jgi:hypothetical protein